MTLATGAEPAGEVREGLRRAGVAEARFDAHTRNLYSRDASMYTITPLGVVFPETPTRWPRSPRSPADWASR
ncbi:hypothetical protein ACFQXA_14175 [Nocardiopsis composta]